ncbi:MAG: ComF family protein [Christensenellales bacterium]
MKSDKHTKRTKTEVNARSKPKRETNANKTLVKLIRNIRQAIFVDKYNCINCGKELANPNRYGLCDECKSKIEFLYEDVCHKCGRREKSEADYCLTCQAHERHFLRNRSVCVYDGIAKSLIHRYKFGGKKYYCSYFANMLVDKYLDEGYDCDVVTSVPISKERARKRGYNQSQIVAKRLAEALKLPYVGECIVKSKDNIEQAKLSGKEREENVLGVYKVIDKTAVKGKRVLVVDDVLTTGATMSEVARVLYKAGAQKVEGLTICATTYKIQSSNLCEEDNNEE